VGQRCSGDQGRRTHGREAWARGARAGVEGEGGNELGTKNEERRTKKLERGTAEIGTAKQRMVQVRSASRMCETSVSSGSMASTIVASSGRVLRAWRAGCRGVLDRRKWPRRLARRCMSASRGLSGRRTERRDRHSAYADRRASTRSRRPRQVGRPPGR
jgi:hypothetical protein